MKSYNPVRIALWEWGRMARDVLAARSVPQALNYLFAPPGWSPEFPRRYSKLTINNPFKIKQSKERL